jgi:acyl carrier protein
MRELEGKTKAVFSDVLKIPAADIDENTSSQTVSQWDSLRHMELIIGLEKTLGVEIRMDDIPKMKSYRDVIAVLSDLLDIDSDA